MGKIVELIQDAQVHNRHFFGLEFFPPQNDVGVENLYGRLQRMSAAGPTFCSITWGGGGSAANDTALKIAETAQQYLALEMQVHLTGRGATAAQVRGWLSKIKAAGVRNLFLLRGVGASPHAGTFDEEFPYAADLVRFVRAEHGDYFSIAVAGYPEGHEDCPDAATGLRHLKAKVDAGADLVITQMVFCADTFVRFCRECRQAGIECPIVPGIMPVHSLQQFRRYLKAPRPPAGIERLAERLKGAGSDDAEAKRIGIDFTVGLVRELKKQRVRGMYFFTMNLETHNMQVLQRSYLAHGPAQPTEAEDDGGTSGRLQGDPTGPTRAMPWQTSADAARCAKEEVRPIFWSGRAKSYLARTAGWDEFPNGRWGSIQSPAFGENPTYHVDLMLSAATRQCHWLRQAHSLPEVCRGFVQFLDGAVALPWCEALESEADLLMDAVLRPLNRRGLLTINSQPAVNGAPSSDPKVGWGPPMGYCYQKQYLEFFCSRETLSTVAAVFAAYSSLTFMAVDSAGTHVAGALADGNEAPGANAVTWGVFPDREVLQPTVVAAEAFDAWALEAFDLWRRVFARRPPQSPLAPTEAATAGAGPVLSDTVAHIVGTWVLVNVVDNDFVATPTKLNTAVGQIVSQLPELC